MRVEIEIPKEYELDYRTDKFREFFERVLCDIQGGDLCGRYERETAKMFVTALQESRPVRQVPTLDYETATEILQNPVFDDDCSWMAAVTFISEAFNRSMDSILEEIRPKEQCR